MASYDYGKKFINEWIRNSFPEGATCLDVGACDGKWHGILGDYLKMDAVEIWKPYADEFNLKDKYNKLFIRSIDNFKYEWYDIVLFGDVIEHMNVSMAQRVLDHAQQHSECVIVGVPFQYKQGAINGNPYEEHIQDDLTPELFEARYKGFELLLRANHDYYYYVG